MRTILIFSLVVAISVGLTGCLLLPPLNQELTTTITSNLYLDGSVSLGGTAAMEEDMGWVFTGHWNPLIPIRAFFSFDLTAVPKAAKISRALVRIYKTSDGGDPYRLGYLILDHLDYGSALDSSDFSLEASKSYARNVTFHVIGWYEEDVTDSVIADKSANKTYSQFRLRRSNETADGDGFNCLDNWVSGNKSQGLGAPDQRPQLVITYTN